MTTPKAQRYRHRLPYGEDRLRAKLRKFVQKVEHDILAKFRATGPATMEYETESGKTGECELYQDATKKWRFRKVENDKK